MMTGLKGNGISPACRWGISLGISFFMGTLLFAGEKGPLTYTLHDAMATITHCDPSATGALIVSEEIEGCPVVALAKNSFKDCGAVTSVILPDGLTYIGNCAFWDCRELTHINLPAGVVNLEHNTFLRCELLREVVFSSALTNIAQSAFSGCSSLEFVTLPERLETIGNGAFGGCRSLVEITLPSQLVRVEDYAFSGCDQLARITFPASLVDLGVAVFPAGPALEWITVEEGNRHFCSIDGVLFDATKSRLFRYPPGKMESVYSIPQGVRSVENQAFNHGNSLTQISLPDSLTRLGNGAFSGCNSLTDLILPPQLIRISDHAFSGCCLLSELRIPKTVSSIGVHVFLACDALESIAVDEGNARYSSRDGVLFDEEEMSLWAYPQGNPRGVYSIPEGVVQIADWAFAEAVSLQKIIFPPSVTRLGEYSFFKCTSLVDFVLPEALVYIGKSAFSSCRSLVHLEIPKGVTQIHVWTFLDCSSLESVVLPQYLVSIDNWAFFRCYSLAHITLPLQLKRIGAKTFFGCSSLVALTLPESLDTLGEGAMLRCKDLERVVFLGEIPERFGIKVFDETDEDFMIHYFSEKTGISSPSWTGYPATSWFLDHGLDPSVKLDQDLNGDGLSLQMAFALNLDPNQNLSGCFLQQTISPNSMSILYYAVAPGVKYTVETSTDLKVWTSTGVVLSSLDDWNQRTARVDLSDEHRFLRLRVESGSDPEGE